MNTKYSQCTVFDRCWIQFISARTHARKTWNHFAFVWLNASSVRIAKMKMSFHSKRRTENENESEITKQHGSVWFPRNSQLTCSLLNLMKINFYYELITSMMIRQKTMTLVSRGGWNLIYIGAPNWVSVFSLFIAKQYFTQQIDSLAAKVS